jgi:hypothetical protein
MKHRKLKVKSGRICAKCQKALPDGTPAYNLQSNGFQADENGKPRWACVKCWDDHFSIIPKKNRINN